MDLSDRGTIQLGKRADLNVIDFDNLNVSIPEIVHDCRWWALQQVRGYLAKYVVEVSPIVLEMRRYSVA